MGFAHPSLLGACLITYCRPCPDPLRHAGGDARHHVAAGDGDAPARAQAVLIL